MRHGIPLSGAETPDRERALSPEGAQEIVRAAAGLAAIGIRFDRIFTSPLARAAQTAAIMAGSGVEPEETEALAGGVVPEVLFQAIGRLPADARILLVGHEPDMSGLAASLVGAPADHSIPFGRGSIARIDVDGLPPRQGGRLVWLLTSRLAGELAG